ncbi:non-ribosomal peptide synthetase [Crateriforma conspicua]|uniref:Polyketide synthase PksJ n=1 Tax=Crateriforma conspicua TaxID=2527996 RepID=A0A5C6G0W2_9PLAN|nr:non-ribosomal peptide synthetase [Crateriforma conspicua]TWU67120.1 Polyketide synthase PksJ [Crateriforma conspicua]
MDTFPSPSSTTFSGVTSHGTVPVVVQSQATDDRFPCSEAQLEIWLASQQSEEANCAYNEISSLTFHGALDVDALKSAINRVMERHASLRCDFADDGRTVRIHDSVAPSIRFLDWSTTSQEQRERLTYQLIRDEGSEPFDLTTAPLIRFALQKFSDDHHKLTFTAHHLVMDGWSLSVFCHDLGAYYDQEIGVRPRQDLPPTDYRDFASAMKEYENSEQRQADESFWKQTYQGGIPNLDLPHQGRRQKLRTYAADRYDHTLPPHLIAKLKRVSAKSGCSLFGAMLAGFGAYVSRICGTNDLILGIPTAGQAATDLPDLIGHCVNTMPLRITVDDSLSFAEHLTTTRTAMLDALDHQRLSFGSLLRLLAPPRDPSRPPMVSVSFNVDPMIDTNQIGFSGLSVTPGIEPRAFENFDWFVNGVILNDDSIEMQVQYNRDLFTAEAMRFYLQGFEAFLDAAIESPLQPIGRCPVMSVPQRQAVIADWNDTSLDLPDTVTLHELFEAQANKSAARDAAEFQGRRLTYGELETKANQQARVLRNQGVQTGDLVGICVERSEQMLVHLYAILKAGAAYVPLDPAYPTDRLAYMCDHSGLTMIVTQSHLIDRVAQFNKPMVAFDQMTQQIAEQSPEPLGIAVAPDDLCYVIYTSGSTGKPKGVQVPHGAVVNFLMSMQQEPGFTPDDVLLAVTTLSFDISVLELFLPTVTGGKVVILDSVSAADGNALSDAIDRHAITVLQATPSTWRLLIQSRWSSHKALDRQADNVGQSDPPNTLKALCGGEPMPGEIVAPLLRHCDELWNMYGPTETTVWSAAYRITDENAPILIGKPIGNTQIYLLDSEGRETPPGCEGELHIGGAGVTRGYRNRLDLTDEKFIENRYRNPYADYVSDRLYRTGDIAKLRFDGQLEFVRRNDKQVKVRGFRIELGEIETHLKSHPLVAQNAVIVREDKPGDKRLVAYIVALDGQSIDTSRLREHLRQFVPPYMVPQHFISLPQMPLTNNGKVDHKSLPKPNELTDVRAVHDVRATEHSHSESYLMSLCTRLLEHTDVALDDIFLDVGGHSLLVMQIIATVERDKGFKFSPQDFLVNTLGQLTSKLEAATESKADERSAKQPDSQPDVPGVDRSADQDIEITQPKRSFASRFLSRWKAAVPTQEHTKDAAEQKGFWD